MFRSNLSQLVSPQFLHQSCWSSEGHKTVKGMSKGRIFSILIPNFSIISTYFTRIQWVLTLGDPFGVWTDSHLSVAVKSPSQLNDIEFLCPTFQFFIAGLLAKNHSYSKLVLVRCQDFVQEKTIPLKGKRLKALMNRRNDLNPPKTTGTFGSSRTSGCGASSACSGILG